MPKKKIAHIITQLELGGAQKTTLLILKYLNTDKYEPHLITSTDGPLADYAYSLPQLKIFNVSSLTSRINPFRDIISFFKILRYLKREKISIVHTHSTKAGIIGRWAGTLAGCQSIFHTVHGWPFYIEANGFFRSILLFFERATSSITERIVVVSNADLQAGLKRVCKDRSKYVKIYYGIESQLFRGKSGTDPQQRTPLFKSLNIDQGRCVVGSIACFKPQKAPQDLIKTASLVIDRDKDTQFLLIGDGALRQGYEDISLSLGLKPQMKFLGWRHDVNALLSVIDILVLTSHWEGMPVVLLEAMASGVPVVATDVGGVSEIVKHGLNGFLEKKGACEDLAGDILTLIKSPGKRREFSDNARRSFLETFDITCMMDGIHRLYEARSEQFS
ncbi:MAG: glycosyltransferase family 4 protein [Candidatus Omnitrophica bacterium]|nr:glycosyltransferase family 4 protein [Candidatus Omnitrophota bacterium]